MIIIVIIIIKRVQRKGINRVRERWWGAVISLSDINVDSSWVEKKRLESKSCWKLGNTVAFFVGLLSHRAIVKFCKTLYRM